MEERGLLLPPLSHGIIFINRKDDVKKQIKLIEIILPVVITAIIDLVVMLILNLVLLTLDLTWLWNLVTSTNGVSPSGSHPGKSNSNPTKSNTQILKKNSLPIIPFF
jgi:hypothetical protein